MLLYNDGIEGNIIEFKFYKILYLTLMNQQFNNDDLTFKSTSSISNPLYKNSPELIYANK